MTIFGQLLEILLQALLFSNGKRVDVHVSWPVATLTFLLAGLLLGITINSAFKYYSIQVVTASSAVLLTTVALIVYANKVALGFPISTKLWLTYSLSLFAGIGLVLFAAAS